VRRVWTFVAAVMLLVGLGSASLGYALGSGAHEERSAGWTSYVPLTESDTLPSSTWWVAGRVLLTLGLLACGLALRTARRFVPERG
jgi:heme/copper-type cytochrome/quinol oxidase subunit 1